MNQTLAFDKLTAMTRDYDDGIQVEQFLGDRSLIITSFVGSPHLRDLQREFGELSLFFSGQYDNNDLKSGLVLSF